MLISVVSIFVLYFRKSLNCENARNALHERERERDKEGGTTPWGLGLIECISGDIDCAEASLQLECSNVYRV